MLVDHMTMDNVQQTVLPRAGRKRRARTGDLPGAVERAKTPRRQVVPPAQRITKPEPDEDSGLGFDDPHEPPAGAAETAHLLRTGLVASVRKAARSRDDGAATDSCFVSSTSDVQPPRAFLKGVNSVSKCGKYRLTLAREPEARHRARYQTEGSRGAVKDATGKTSPQVVLHGCSDPVALQMYVGSDADGCRPHLFYQSCRVTGKTASPSEELLLSGTVVIQTTMTPDKDGSSVSARCDCLGILKQRNVDIETRVAAAGGVAPCGGGASATGRRSAVLRKGARTTSCRLVFRVTILNGHGRAETLQIASRSIVCTQPQGVPEVTKLSISEASPAGGQELIVLGKNFVKDSRVVFTETTESGTSVWTRTVTPHKEHLQAVHLVCDVPAYWDSRLTAPRSISLTVRSGDRESDGVPFAFVPTAAGPATPTATDTADAADDTELSASPDRTETAGGNLPNGVSQAAIAINRHFAETGEILLANNVQPTEQAKATAAAQTELATSAVAVAIQPSQAAGPRSEKLPTLLVPVVTDAGRSPNVFVTVALPSSAEAAAAGQAVWAARREPHQPLKVAAQQQQVTGSAAWASPPPAESSAANTWSSPQQPDVTTEDKWSPAQTEVSAQNVWPSAASQGTPQSSAAWSQAAIVSDSWSPTAAPAPADTTGWPSPQPETPAGQSSWSPAAPETPAGQTTWSPAAPETVAETDWSSPKAETAAQNVWPSAAVTDSAGQDGSWSQTAESPAKAAESIWKQEVETIVSESVQSWATESAEAVSQHSWPQPEPVSAPPAVEAWPIEADSVAAAAPAAWSSLDEAKAALEREWPAAESRRSWSSDSESKASPVADWTEVTAQTKAAAGEQSWAPLVEVKPEWIQKVKGTETATAPQTWAAPAAEKTWPTQQQQQQANLHSPQQQQQQQAEEQHHQHHQQQQAVQQHQHHQQAVQQQQHQQQQQAVQQQHQQQAVQQQQQHHQQQQAVQQHHQQQQAVQQHHQQQQAVQQHHQRRTVQQQPQQQWAAEAAVAEVRSMAGGWSQEQLADVLQETVSRSPVSVTEPGPAAASGPGPAAQTSRSDPMWGEVSFTAPGTAAADDPLADLPKGMELIDYINGDNV